MTPALGSENKNNFDTNELFNNDAPLHNLPAFTMMRFFLLTFIDVLRRRCRLKVIRTLKFNKRWAAKLEKQKARRLAREEAKREREAAAEKAKKEQEERAKVNPFSAAPSSANGGGMGGMLFGGGSDNPFAAPAPAAAAPITNDRNEEEREEEEYSDEEESEEESESERLAEELALKSDLASTSTSPTSLWVESSTRYPALYLNTIPEPSSSSTSSSKKLSPSEAAAIKSAPGLDDEEIKGFAKEGYEKMLLDGIDSTFERFLKRVEVEPRQAVRYEFGGEPVAFHAKGRVFDLLWPKEKKVKAGEGVAVTKGQFKQGEPAPGERVFSARAVPPCEVCGAVRVFEAQLMPNLINLLKADRIQKADGSLDSDTSAAPQDTKSAIEQALGRRLPNSEGKKEGQEEAFDARSGLVWSTAFVFVCSQDCVGNKGEEECWREELVLAQFEDEQ